MSALDFLDKATWHHEPATWSIDKTLTLVTHDKTDFWQNTWYQFHRDDGHFYGAPVTGDFTAVCEFSGDYTTLYDQAGLMLRVDAQRWIKTGIEFSDGVMNFSVVVTNVAEPHRQQSRPERSTAAQLDSGQLGTGQLDSDQSDSGQPAIGQGHSDWSVIQQPLLHGPQSVRLTRINDAVLVHYLNTATLGQERSSDQKHSGDQWRLMRVAHFPAGGTALLGPMACSPTRAGFKAEFHRFAVTEPIADPLHTPP